ARGAKPRSTRLATSNTHSSSDFQRIGLGPVLFGFKTWQRKNTPAAAFVLEPWVAFCDSLLETKRWAAMPEQT
ncbi:hypothetical protein, partial [Pseudomonas syringae]|uniref:hypothetical protein n=1 Tax=Pseudomonas syringae TaxID=317 RepID=UPI001F478B9C